MSCCLPDCRAAVVLAAMVLPLAAQVPPTINPGVPAAFEVPVALPAAHLAQPELLQGPGYVVEASAATDGLLAYFRLRTEGGEYDCHGTEMLALRVDEVRALRELAAINEGEAFLQAAGGAIAKPLEGAARIVRDPVGSVQKVPAGIAGLFQRAGRGLEQIGGAVAKGADQVRRELEGEAPDPAATGAPRARQDPFGFNRNRNQWAAKVRADPYSSNPELAAALDRIAAVTFTTELAAGFGVAAVAAPLAWVGRVDEFVLTQPPAVVREHVASELVKLGCTPGAVSAFTANPWFTPTLQMRLLAAAGKLAGAANLDAIPTAAAQAHGEVEARFQCAVFEMLAAHKGAAPLKSLVFLAPLVCAVTAESELLACAPLDLLLWMPETAAFAERGAGFPKRRLLLTCRPSEAAAAGLAAAGWQVEAVAR
jgi:hypothetical protein